jgi:hypothetical protein
MYAALPSAPAALNDGSEDHFAGYAGLVLPSYRGRAIEVAKFPVDLRIQKFRGKLLAVCQTSFLL